MKDNIKKETYIVVLDALVPAKIHYRVSATSQEEAYMLVNSRNVKPDKIQYIFDKKINKLLQVFKEFTSNILFTRRW